MIPISAISAVIVTLLVSLVLPLMILLVFAAKHRKQGIVSAWLLGAAGFLVTQMLIRLPILSSLSGQAWFIRFSQEHLFSYAFSLAFTAGLFELAGRYAVAKCMQKHLTLSRSLASGLGHGGIEAIAVTGMAYINNLIYIFMINSGTFDVLIAQSAAAGVGPALLEGIRTALMTTSPILFLLAGFERLLAMTGHLAMSLLVCRGVAVRKPLPALLACLGLHTLMDLTAGISLLSGTVLSQTAAYTIIYAILTLMAAISLLIIRDIVRRWHNTEVLHAEK